MPLSLPNSRNSHPEVEQKKESIDTVDWEGLPDFKDDKFSPGPDRPVLAREMTDISLPLPVSFPIH